MASKVDDVVPKPDVLDEVVIDGKKAYPSVDKIDGLLAKYVRTLNTSPSFKKAISLILGEHGRHLGRWIALESEAMVKLYTSSIYIQLNKALRRIGGVKLTQELKAMQLVLDDALSRLPIYNQGNKLLQRSVYFTEKEIKKLFKVGEDFVENGFMSTTHSEEALKQWLIDNPTHNVILKVYGKNGKLIEKASMLPFEHEVLFRSGTTFVVDSMKPIPNPIDRTKKVLEIILKEK